MTQVGASHAKTHLFSLLNNVMNGEEVLITRRGLPVARLIPPRQAKRAKIESVIERLRAIRTGRKLGGLDWKKLRDEGRR